MNDVKEENIWKRGLICHMKGASEFVDLQKDVLESLKSFVKRLNHLGGTLCFHQFQLPIIPKR